MPLPYDSAVKTMVAIEPTALPVAMNIPARRVQVVDTDVSIVSAATDAAVRITDDQGDFLLHMEFQSRHDPAFLSRAAMYQAIYHHRTQLHVKTVLIFLTRHAWREAYGSGEYTTRHGGEAAVRATFSVIKAWELSRAALLTHPGMLPLVALTAFDQDSYSELMDQIDAALRDHPHRADLLAVTHVLAGLRDDGLQFANALNTRFPLMEDSLTYQQVRQSAIKEGQVKGRDAGLHEAIYTLAEARLGTPDSPTIDALNAVHDPDRLRRLVIAAANATSWADLIESA